MKYIPLFAALAALGLAACDKQEEARKDAVKDQAKALDKEADAVRAESKASADITKANGEQAAKDLEKKADAVREQK
jgi:hypothetical protein